MLWWCLYLWKCCFLLVFLFLLMLWFCHWGEWEHTSKCLPPWERRCVWGWRGEKASHKERLYKFIKSLTAALMGSAKQKRTSEENKRARGQMETTVLVGFWLKKLGLLYTALLSLLPSHPPPLLSALTLFDLWRRNFSPTPPTSHLPTSLQHTADSSCLWNQFACSKNKCIAKQWLCDGENDCEDGLDESAQICGE